MVPGHNYVRRWFGTRLPSRDSQQKAVTRVITLLSPKSTSAGDYSITSLTLLQVEELLTDPSPVLFLLSRGAGGGSKESRSPVRDACCLPADASSAVHSSGPDSDVGPVVLLQLVGEKSLRTAGDHLPPEGTAGETVLIEGGLLHGFSDASK